MPAGGVSLVSQGSRLLERLRAGLLRPAVGELSDGQLLQRFLAGREEAAFALLLRRHGPMVLGVCRRVLRQEQDAEDAFQATFLVLAKKAASVEPRERVGPWLYGVAYRTALKARSLAARRREVERAAARPAGTSDESHPDDLRTLLERHLSQLPDRFRAPLILCDLQGRPRPEVARQLGLPEGTLSSRLARGRALLGRRLRRHGIALAASGLAAALAGEATAAPPAALTAATTAGALSVAAGLTAGVPAHVLILTEGVLKAMTISKLKVAAAVLLSLAVLGMGVGVLSRPAMADRPAVLPSEPARGGDQKSKDAKEGKEEAETTVTVTVKAVDTGKHTLTAVVGNKKEQQEKTYELARDVRVILNDGRTKGDKGQEGSVSDVTAGRSVELRLAPGGKAVAAITLRPWSLSGAVKSVDAGKRTLTVTTKGENGEVEKTYSLVEGGHVLLSDRLTKEDKEREGKLADLAAGTTVQVRVSAVDPKTALELRPQGKSLFGELKGVDVDGRTITVTVKEDGGLVDKALSVDRKAKLTMSNALGSSSDIKLKDLKAGLPVLVQLSVFDATKAVRVTEQHGDR
jgi:RNA polymerase sigma factor (sigma-70 family)